MIRTLQRRFVLTAMLSLFVLLVLLIGGIIGASYIIMERSTDQALDMFMSDTPPSAPNRNERLPFFGYQVIPNSPHFLNHAIIIVNTDGEIISVDNRFTSILDNAQIQEYALDVLKGGKEQGKISSFKYALAELETGNYKITLLDVSVQAQMLADTVRVSILIGLACMVMMFFILMLVSRRTVQPIANSIEKQRRFVTDAGHEIKTPLAIIQANVDAMELRIGENKWSRHIREQSMRLDGLMKQLLSLAKTDEAAAPSFNEIELSKLVKKCVSAFAEIGAGKTIEVSIAPQINTRGNPEGLEQLLLILLDNALKYSADGGTIYVKLYESRRKKVIEVINTCPELPDTDPRTLFDRFYRADTARTQKNGGYGIGLSIAQAVTEAHRGKISAFYDDKHTIRFRVEL